MAIDNDDMSFDYVISDNYKDIDLIGSFHESFPELTAATTKEQILYMVNINPGIRDWYLKFKQYRSTFLVKPDWLPDDKEALENWAELKDKLTRQKKMFREWDSRIESKSKALKAEIHDVSQQKSAYMKDLHPLLVISSLNVNFLSASDALEIALVGDFKERERLIADKVRILQQSYYTGYINGNFTNPYLK